MEVLLFTVMKDTVCQGKWLDRQFLLKEEVRKADY